MAVKEATTKYILNQYAAHWFPLTPSNGLKGWLHFLESDNTDDWCANEAMRRVIAERIENQRFANKDILKLTEYQAVYYKVVRELRERDKEQLRQDDCNFCGNTGIRWVVAHANGYMKTENLITALPENTSDIRKFVYKYTIPCSCQRGMDLKDSRVASIREDGRYVVPIEPNKHYRILKHYSMDHDTAWRLEMAYNTLKREVFGLSRTESDEDRERRVAFDGFITLAKRKITEAEGITHEQERGEVPF